MSLLAFGVNHRTAPVSFRERVAFASDELPGALRALAGCDGVREAAILSTCNRTDVYCGLGHESGERVVEWLRDYHRLGGDELRRHLYSHRSESAVRHLMRVASGLDSMVLGEPQILGQVKDAYRAACEEGTVGAILGRLFESSFAVAKLVRTDTAIGSSPISVAFAAVDLARQIFGDLGARTALLVGAGETIELAARHLQAQGLGRMIVANRTVENAHRLADQFGGYAVGLEQMHGHLADADIVLSSTGSPDVLLRVDEVRAALEARKRRPMLLVDIAVPLDIDPRAGDLEDAFLYTVDDLEAVIEDNLRGRREAAQQAEEIIDRQVDRFMGWLGTRAVSDTIRSVRAGAEESRDEVLARARRLLAAGTEPEEALRYLANTLTNKLMHRPTVRIRQAGAEARSDVVSAARSLFGVDAEAGPDDTEPRG